MKTRMNKILLSFALLAILITVSCSDSNDISGPVSIKQNKPLGKSGLSSVISFSKISPNAGSSVNYGTNPTVFSWEKVPASFNYLDVTYNFQYYEISIYQLIDGNAYPLANEGILNIDNNTFTCYDLPNSYSQCTWTVRAYYVNSQTNYSISYESNDGGWIFYTGLQAPEITASTTILPGKSEPSPLITWPSIPNANGYFVEMVTNDMTVIKRDYVLTNQYIDENIIIETQNPFFYVLYRVRAASGYSGYFSQPSNVVSYYIKVN